MTDQNWAGDAGAGGTPGPHVPPTSGAWQQPAFTPQPGYAPQPGYGQQPGYGGYPQRTNGMAVASMVLGILWIYWIGSILALVFGYIARNQIRERGDGGAGMAVAGIVLGWVGVGILGLFLLIGIAGRASF